MDQEQQASEQLTSEQMQALWDEEAAAVFAANPSTDAAPAGTSADEVTQQPAQPATQAPAQPQQQEDPLAGLHPALRQQWEEMQRQFRRMSNIEGHIGGLKSAMSRVEQEAAAAKAAAERFAQQPNSSEQPSAQQIAAAQKTPEKWNQLKEDFPEWAEAIEERLSSASTGGSNPQLMQELASVRQQLDEVRAASGSNQQVQELMTQVDQLRKAVVEQKHAGWLDTIKTPEFHQWWSVQPDEERARGASYNPMDAIYVLDKYVAHQRLLAQAQATQQQRQQRVSAAASLPTGRPVAPDSTDPSQLEGKALWDFYASNPQALDRRI